MLRLRRRLLSAAALMSMATALIASLIFPTSAHAASCGSVTANKPTLQASVHKAFASGVVSDSCSGWTKYCVYLVHEFLAGAPYPTPQHSYDASTCTALKTGLISGSSTKAVTCHAGYYITEVRVYQGSSQAKRVTSAKYDYTGSCLQP